MQLTHSIAFPNQFFFNLAVQDFRRLFHCGKHLTALNISMQMNTKSSILLKSNWDFMDNI